MALAKLHSDIIEIRGRFGGVYFKRDPSGQHIQTWPRAIRKASMLTPKIYPESPGGSRAAYINSFTRMAQLWATLLVIYFMPLWIAHSINNFFKTPKGTKKLIPGWNWFVHYNLPRAMRGQLNYWKPPPRAEAIPDLVVVSTVVQYWDTTPPFNPNDCTAYYYVAGTYNGKDYYLSDTGEWFVWWNGVSWIISKILGDDEIPPFYYHLGPSPYGDWTGTGGWQASSSS